MIHIREATELDLPAVLGLLREDAIREVEEPAEVTEGQRAALCDIIARPDQQVLVGEVAGELVATCQVAWLRRLFYDGAMVCLVESVRVSSGVRGQGHGAELMEYVCAEARRRRCARIELTTNRRRQRARRFYERLGFRPSHVGMKLYLQQAPYLKEAP
ncbi:MAG TPA: GNAT family N-acetyltransferase [Nocardioidaceae bacterium]|nr:GNAT family N-acetyltransferase [Nocardioidaceae bacterium]